MSLQGLVEEFYNLDHCQFDSFSWLRLRNELVNRGRWVLQPAMYSVFDFNLGEEEKAESLVWFNDAGVPQGETFFRKATDMALRGYVHGVYLCFRSARILQ
jgi:hypothetical protein